MTTMHTDSKAHAAIDAAIARAQKAAKVPLSAPELRAIELATMRDIAKQELAAKNAAVSLAAKAKADSERIAKLQARAKYGRTQLMREAVTIEYAATFSSVTSGKDSQAYCRQVAQTVQKTVTRTIAVCADKVNDFLREVATATLPATIAPIADAKSKAWRAIDKLMLAAKQALAAGNELLLSTWHFDVVTKNGHFFKVVQTDAPLTKVGLNWGNADIPATTYAPVFADGVAVRDTLGLMRYLTAI